MDIEKMIKELRAERDRLSQTISALEQLQASSPTNETPKRRGRKFMDKEGRREVSERMKQYWAEQRKKREKGKSAAADSGSEEPGDTTKNSDNVSFAA